MNGEFFFPALPGESSDGEKYFGAFGGKCRAYLHGTGGGECRPVTDGAALRAFRLLASTEGVIRDAGAARAVGAQR
ncbi:hypothetical protein ACRYCC_34500 [Actinomadura scrupuli]|uniref:hypothetical protein n=1 Tax=Actinomadura scrupuli TaxID=559629 RepID=UPI003D98EE59